MERNYKDMVKPAYFVINFEQVEHLCNGIEVFLEWGKGPSNRTKTVRVVDGVADFRGESLRQEITMKRDKKYPEYWKSYGITLKLRNAKGKPTYFSPNKNTIATMKIDLGRLTSSQKDECFKDLTISVPSSNSVQSTLLSPELKVSVSCSWNDPELLKDEKNLYLLRKDEHVSNEEIDIRHKERVRESEEMLKEDLNHKPEVKSTKPETHGKGSIKNENDNAWRAWNAKRAKNQKQNIEKSNQTRSKGAMEA